MGVLMLESKHFKQTKLLSYCFFLSSGVIENVCSFAHHKATSTLLNQQAVLGQPMLRGVCPPHCINLMNQVEKSVTSIVFVAGIILSYFHTLFIILTVAGFASIAYVPINWVSRRYFNKGFEYPSRHDDNQKYSWSDYFLCLPMLCFVLVPLFAAGELADCATNSQVWEVVYGFCK